ncbi:MAG TPA: murein biosynthesis integral membrane protein MurJ [Solirubrobacteraceae bacterium]|nr:murein biosynthesis integral membrane protein MurJ [Solirubrobacteraceae bacterium]
MTATDDSQRRRLSVNTAIFAGATALSRVVGLGREIIAASLFGTSPAASAFTIASQIPNLMSNLFAQAALSAAFVPVFTELLQEGRKKEAFRLASTLFWIVFIVLGTITVFGVLLAGVILPLFGGADFDGHAAAVLTQIMFPVVLVLGLTGVITGILQSYDEFSLPAIAPVLWNGVIIAVMVTLKGSFSHGHGIYAYAVAWLIATVVQFVFIASALRRIDYRLELRIDWRDPRVRQVFALMLPVTLGLGIINLDALINSAMGALVHTPQPGAGPRAIQLAFLIYMLPQGVFSVAVSTVLFPTLSRQASRRAPAEMRNTLGTGMRQINLLLIPSAIGMLALARPITRLVFMHGKFNLVSLDLTSEALFWFAFSLPFAGLNLLMTRTFFALQRPWIPTKLAAINMTVDIIVSVALYKPLGIAGLVIGTASANIVMTYLQLRRLRIGFNGHLDLEQTRMITARIVVVSVATGFIARILWELLDKLAGVSIPGQIVSVGGAVVIAGGFYAWAISRMRVPEWQQIESMVRSRLRR